MLCCINAGVQKPVYTRFPDCVQCAGACVMCDVGDNDLRFHIKIHHSSQYSILAHCGAIVRPCAPSTLHTAVRFWFCSEGNRQPGWDGYALMTRRFECAI